MVGAEKYKIDLDFCPMPILLVASSGEIVQTNRRMEDLFGYDENELIGRSVEILVPEEIRAVHPKLRTAFFEFPTPRQMGTGRDLHGVRKDGKMIPIEIGLDPIEFDGERMVMVSILDIRERKNNEAMIRRAMDAAASAMIQVDEDGRIELVNEQAVRVFGYDRDELLEMGIEDLIPERFRTPHKVYRTSYQQTRDPREMRTSQDLIGLRKDGTEFPAEVGLTPILEKGGNSTMATIIDVTDRREHERQIHESNEQLRLLNDELTDFAYSASHDLKAPLTSIAGLLAYCATDLMKGELDEVGQNVERARVLIDRLAGRIEDMLSLARADTLSNKHVTVDVARIVDDVWNMLQDDRIQFSTSFEHEEPFFCVQTRFFVVLENLVSNAIKYCDPDKEEKRIRIETWSDDDRFHLTVSDNGIGIPPEYQHKLFRMFQRVSNNNEPGSGLGLALVRKHVTALKGQVSLESNEGWTEFKVVLPQMDCSQLEVVAEELV